MIFKSKTNAFVIFFTFVRTFNSTYETSNSASIAFFIAVLVCCGIELLFWIGATIWSSKLNMIARLALISGSASLIGGGFYITVAGVSNYIANCNSEEKIKKIFTAQDIDYLKKAYCARYEIDIEKTATETIDRLQNCLVSDSFNVDQYIHELDGIDVILQNPFIVNECDTSTLMRVRAIIIEILKGYGEDKNLPDFLESLHVYEKRYQIIRESDCDRVRFEACKILIEQGPREYFRFFEQLFQTKDGRAKIKRLAALQGIEAQLLDLVVEERDQFESLAMRSLLKMPEYVERNFDMQGYIKDHFSNGLRTIEGRRKIIQDIQKLIAASTIYVEVLCTIGDEKGNVSFAEIQRLVKNRIGPKIKNIIQTIGITYE